MKLSIVITYYNLEKYIDELLDVLVPQLTEETECILVDDGSKVPFTTNYDCIKVYRKENGGCATARNLGMDKASGEYIAFIDGDDVVANNYINKLLDKIEKEEPDVIDLSWRSLSLTEGTQHRNLLSKNFNRLLNPSVCTRCFKRSFIGDVRFNEFKDSTEDEDFTRKLGVLDRNNTYKHAAICEYMYFYRTAVTNSKIKHFKAGLMKTKRTVYYYDHVTASMTNLLEEIKEEDKYNEVFLLTNQCDIPELNKYCQIKRPMSIWAHYIKGEPFDKITKMELPIKTQIVIYCEYINKVGGIGTFIYNWCLLMKDIYDIIFLYNDISEFQINRLSKIVRCEHETINRKIVCDTIILNRITDKVPDCVLCNRVIQIAHCCSLENRDLPVRDINVFVSNASRDSWLHNRSDIVFKETKVIHNPLILTNDNYEEEIVNEIKQAKAEGYLIIISATRIGASDKGLNDQRFTILIDMLNSNHISFKWFNFSDNMMYTGSNNFINKKCVLNCLPIIAEADYLVQLSDKEAYSYSILEALALHVPVLATPFESLFEQGFVDGATGYIIPFDMDFDIKTILNIPKFTYKVDNEEISNQWKELLGDITFIPKSNIKYTRPDFYTVRILTDYYDKNFNKIVKEGEVYEMEYERVLYLINNFPSFIEIIR